jgi:hypothetical protein
VTDQQLSTGFGKIYSILSELCELRGIYEGNTKSFGQGPLVHANSWDDFDLYIHELEIVRLWEAQPQLSETWVIFGKTAFIAGGKITKEKLRGILEAIEVLTVDGERLLVA